MHRVLERAAGLLVIGILAAGCSNKNDPISPPPVTPTPLHGCTSFDDRSAAAADRTVAVGVSGLIYEPKCLLIAAGQTATFAGNFSTHPLRPGKAPGRNRDSDGSPNNPIAATNSGSAVTFTFPTAGLYPYYCETHGGGAMIGVIKVQ